MKKLLLPLAAVALVGSVAAPALAQPWNGRGGYDSRYDQNRYGQDYGQNRNGGRLDTAYVDSLQWKIDNAARQGRLSSSEARSLRDELRQVQPLAWRVQSGQARRADVERLQRAVDRIEAALNRSSGYRRYDRYDRGDRNWR